jgi:copper resistance protein C
MRRLLLAAAAILVVLLPGTPAWAHNTLLTAEPAQDATLAKAPTSVTPEFRERLNPKFTTIVVSDTARQPLPTSTPAVDGAHGTVTLNIPLNNGRYTVACRVVSMDGHAVQGAYTFTVADPALPAAPAPQSAASAAAAPPSGGIPGGVLIGIGVAGVALAGVAVYLGSAGRRRTRAVAGTFPPS